jgi:hypothetical protein
MLVNGPNEKVGIEILDHFLFKAVSERRLPIGSVLGS